MDFSLNEKQKMLQTSMRELGAKKFLPIADELDRKQEFPMANFKIMCDLGLMGLCIPAAYGGSDGDKVSTVIVIEELSRACASTGGIVDAHNILGTEPIYLYGNEQQKRKFLPMLIKGEKVAAFAITEPDAGSDISRIKTTAVLDGDHYVLNGAKIFITNGDVAGTVIVFAVIPSLGKRGMTAFIVEDGMNGFAKGKKYDKVGMRASTQSELVFENCRVPVANRLGVEGQGMRICLHTLDRGRIGIAAQALGITRAVLEEASLYASQRVQFGGPIGQNQAIAWKLAEMATDLEAARLLTYQAAFLCDAGLPFTKEASMAKMFATELCM
ncbi:MAG: acyl-CoA dehydrogenase family protein, partial [Dehalococcoidales bacterium]|nr:acyl-CoA dehydrogenase family protein [Dehalococcoidales bacterium]